MFFTICLSLVITLSIPVQSEELAHSEKVSGSGKHAGTYTKHFIKYDWHTSAAYAASTKASGANSHGKITQDHHRPTVTKTNYTTREQSLIALNQEALANLSRTLRVRNPYRPSSRSWRIWREQAEINIPILVLSSFFLNDICTEKNIKTILFSQRDCYHLITIFKTLFPNFNSVDFMTSRVAYKRPTPEYIEYVRGLCQEPFLIADGYGTGGSCLEFFRQHFSITPLHIAIMRKGSLCPGICYSTGYAIEKTNYAPYGTLIGFTKNGPVRAKVEYPVRLITPASSCVALATTLLKSNPPNGFSRQAFDLLIAALKRHKPAMGRYHISRAGANSGA